MAMENEDTFTFCGELCSTFIYMVQSDLQVTVNH